MNASFLLFGLLPLIVFVVIDSFAGVKAGVIAGIVFALVEVAYSLYFYRTLDGLTIGSTLLVVGFGLISYYTGNSFAFKIQPVILGVIFGAVLLIMQAFDKPLLVMMTQKYQYMFPTEMRENMVSPPMIEMLTRLSHVLGWGFLIHAGCIAYSVFYLSNWWWLIIRGVGLYVMMALCIAWVRFR